MASGRLAGWRNALLALAGSVLLHLLAVLLLGAAAKRQPDAPPPKPVEVSVVEVEKPKPPEPPPPPPPPPPVEKQKPPPQPVVRVLKPPPKSPEPPTPPPPSAQPKPAEKPPETQPVVIPGLTLESTTDKGSFAVNTGNTLYGKPDTKAREPAEVHPYKAAKFVSAAHLSTQPDLLNGDSVNVRAFYPEEAKKAEFEGDAVVRITIDADGSVLDATLVSDPGMGLGAAALKMLRSHIYKFSPATLDGEPVGTTVSFTVRFTLNN